MKTRFCIYTCDSCDEEASPEWTFTEAAKMARKDGWHIGRDGDFCPRCWSKRRSGAES